MSQENESSDVSVILTLERAKVNKNVIEGVHLVGFQAKNRVSPSKPPYKYKESAVRAAVPLYENQDVYISHGEGTKERRIEEKVGYVTNPRFKEGVGIVGDIVLNDKHNVTEALLWWAENKPDKLGMSHVANNVYDAKENAMVEIRKVHSVDIVDKPSTTDGLFKEGVIMDKANERQLDNMLDAMWMLIHEIQWPLQGNKLPMAERAVKILPVIQDLAKELKLIAAPKTKESEQEKKEPDMEYKDISIDELKKQRSDLVATIAKEAVAAHVAIETKVQESIKEIPDTLKTDVFVTLVREAVVANDDKRLAALVDDRKNVKQIAVVEAAAPRKPTLEDKQDEKKVDTKSIIAAAKKR